MAKSNKDNHTPYNGIPLNPGEVLIPQFINREYADLLEAQGVRSWHTGGYLYRVMYIPVPADYAPLAYKTLNANVNDYLDDQLGPNRYSRCMLEQADGSYSPCRKTVNRKANTCTGCPHRGKADREDRNFIPLEMLEEENYYPAETEPSAEDCVMFQFLVQDLLEALSNKNPLYGTILRLFLQGYDTKQIVQSLPQKKTQAYKTISDCKKAILEYLKQ